MTAKDDGRVRAPRGSDAVMATNLEVMAGARNYRDWMYRRMEPYIGQRLLEVGAGIGSFTE